MGGYVCERCGDSFDTSTELGGHVQLAHESDHGVTEKELMTDLQRVADALGKTPTAKEMRQEGTYSVRTYQTKFGGWNEALKAAGLSPNCRKSIPVDELLEDLHRVADELGRVPSSIDINRHSKFCYDTYRNQIGGWKEVLRTAGYEPRRSYVDSETTSYGPNWEEQRRLALERDSYTCQTPGCEVTREDHLETTGVDLHVHHLKPFEHFVEKHGEDAYLHGNELSNLLTVCSNHHPQWEVFSPIALWMVGLW